MNIEEIRNLLSQDNNIVENYCVINGSILPLAKIEKMGYTEFSANARTIMPKKLYKYFPNKWICEDDGKSLINYSHEALRNNTVYLQSPDLFDDVYDSDIHIEWNEYAYIRMYTYCQRCNCIVDSNTSIEEMCQRLSEKLYLTLSESKDLTTFFTVKPKNEIEDLANQLFITLVKNEILKGADLRQAVTGGLFREYEDYILSLQNKFRTSCFTTSPYSQLMWGGSYASCHAGFCIEYTINNNEQALQDIFLNLFPIVYCKIRPNITEYIVKVKDQDITEETLWNVYFHGALRKSIDWAYQNEWRLLLPNGYSKNNYNIPFFNISKVFLGNRMSKSDRKDIIDICNSKNILYTGIKRSKNYFEMADCEMLCEKCPDFLSDKI